MDTLDLVLSVIAGLAALAGVVILVIILTRPHSPPPPNPKVMTKWSCVHESLEPGQSGKCIQSFDGPYDTKSDCENDAGCVCSANKDKTNCESDPDKCNWFNGILGHSEGCYKCSDLDKKVLCDLSSGCYWNDNATGGGICKNIVSCKTNKNEQDCGNSLGTNKLPCIWNNNTCSETVSCKTNKNEQDCGNSLGTNKLPCIWNNNTCSETGSCIPPSKCLKGPKGNCPKDHSLESPNGCNLAFPKGATEHTAGICNNKCSKSINCPTSGASAGCKNSHMDGTGCYFECNP
jgi:hypothetical protein